MGWELSPEIMSQIPGNFNKNHIDCTTIDGFPIYVFQIHISLQIHPSGLMRGGCIRTLNPSLLQNFSDMILAKGMYQNAHGLVREYGT